jgi:tetratricopeptide (TPR) repeat protein
LVLKALQQSGQQNLQLSYARILIDNQRLNDALVQLRKLSKDMPNFSDVWLLLGAVQAEQAQDTEAKASLLRFLDLEKDKQEVRGLSQAYLMLSQIALKAKNSAEAESWLNKIDDPEQLTQVQVQRANLIASKGDINKARALIAQLPTNTPQAKRGRLQAEVKLLRDYKKYEDAYQVLLKASKEDVADLDLRYEVAMMSEKLGRLDEMEKLLRSIIEAKPDFQHAYNALGFSLADRNIRLPEARELIVTALEFSPEDPFIVDSLGWVEFRMGNKLSALAILERAYSNRPDVEIAAHLGEVHWSLGQQEKARKIWRQAMTVDQNNELLQQTLKRLKVKL